LLMLGNGRGRWQRSRTGASQRLAAGALIYWSAQKFHQTLGFHGLEAGK